MSTKHLFFIVFFISHFSFAITDGELRQAAQEEIKEALSGSTQNKNTAQPTLSFNEAIMKVDTKAPQSLARVKPIHLAVQIQRFSPQGTHSLVNGESYSLSRFSETAMFALDLEYPLEFFPVGIKLNAGLAQNSADLTSISSNYTYSNVSLLSILAGVGPYYSFQPLKNLPSLSLGFHLGAGALIYSQSSPNPLAQTSSQLWQINATSEIQWNISYIFTRIYYTYRKSISDSNAEITPHHFGLGVGVSL